MNNIKGTCFSCLEMRSLTEEHIIPQAIGGRLKAKLYCKECNDKFGEVLDKEISETFGHVGTMLQIQRERGSPRPFEVKEISTNTELYFDGRNLKRKRPIVKYQLSEDAKTLESADVTARSEEELNKIMAGLKTKYQMPGNERKFQEPHAGPVDTTYARAIDTALSRRAVTKMAYSLLCHRIPSSEVVSKAFDETRQYIKTGKGRELASANFVHTRFMSDCIRPRHKILINLDRRRGLVVGYVMIFGTYRFTILLSDTYRANLEWPCLDYTYDPVTLRVVEGSPNFWAPSLSEGQILRPRQTKQFVRQELLKCNRMLEDYVKDYKFLDIEFEQS